MSATHCLPKWPHRATHAAAPSHKPSKPNHRPQPREPGTMTGTKGTHNRQKNEHKTSWSTMTEEDTTTSTTQPIIEEVVWRDDLIRWEGGLNVDTTNIDDQDDDDEEEAFQVDIFADPDPFEMFQFEFKLPSPDLQQLDENDGLISVEIKGYKTDAEQVWQSTGLTLWRASHYLCEYQVEHYSELFQNKRVLELGAGLGLNGILAWRLSCAAAAAAAAADVETNNENHVKTSTNNDNDGNTTSSEVCITDGDSDALVHLRDNIERNRPSGNHNNVITSSKVSCNQLIWGKDSSQKFLQHIAQNQKYHVLLASDIVYAAVIVEPLWETVHTLLEPEGGVFIMAFARRKVNVTIDMVLEAAVKHGFEYELVKEDLEEGIWIYEFKFRI